MVENGSKDLYKIRVKKNLKDFFVSKYGEQNQPRKAGLLNPYAQAEKENALHNFLL